MPRAQGEAHFGKVAGCLGPRPHQRIGTSGRRKSLPQEPFVNTPRGPAVTAVHGFADYLTARTSVVPLVLLATLMLGGMPATQVPAFLRTVS